MKHKFRYFDWYLFLLFIFLLIFGVLMIYTASSTKIGDEILTQNYYLKQLVWISFVFLIFIILYKIPYSFFETVITSSYILSIILLLIVLFMPAVKGSSRWIFLGNFRIQPSEIAKITTILFLAKIITKQRISDFQILIRTVIVVAIPVILILMQPDLGTVLVFGAIMLSMLAFSSLPSYYLIVFISPFFSIVVSFFPVIYIFYLAVLVFILYKKKLSNFTIISTIFFNIIFFLSTPFLWNSLKEYQRNRILTFFNPSLDPLGAGYQIIQSRIAIGSGGFFGKGFLEGTQKNLHFLPEHHTDFIFSVISEELGFVGSIFLIILFFLFFNRMIKCLKKINFLDRRLAAIGIISYLSFQTIINIMINIGLFPTTGIPLPFISYGGSNLVVNSLSVGVFLKYLTDRSFLK